jgi:spore germination cell wall hydrolase CwlJ-like protein
MRTILYTIVAVVALTVMTPGQAETTPRTFLEQVDVAQSAVVEVVTTPLIKVNPTEVLCLAQNIFFEAGSESEEGKVAVAMVTLNRTQDKRFRSTICGVVDQKLTRDIPKDQIIVKKNWLGQTSEERHTIWNKISICQFSWRCMFVTNPKNRDERWVESQRIAHDMLSDVNTYSEFRVKYQDALYFHSTGVRPVWAKQKEVVARVGGHYFYSERNY